jgi:hypothetical protein
VGVEEEKRRREESQEKRREEKRRPEHKIWQMGLSPINHIAM